MDSLIKPDEILGAVRSYVTASETACEDINEDRARILKLYRGRNQGDERRGYSQVKSMDIFEVVDWAMPSLLEQFCGEKAPAQFLPVSEDDVETAKDIGAYCLNVYNSQNDGFNNTYNWIFDALTAKTGYLKVWWDETQCFEREEYSGKTAEEFIAIRSDPDVQLIEYQAEMVWQNEMESEVHNFTILRDKSAGRVHVTSVPPEHILVHPDWDSINISDCPFVAHRELLTASDLIRMGFPKEIVDDLPFENGANLFDDTEDDVYRARRDRNGQSIDGGETSRDPSMRKIWVYECYVRMDCDGDGVAELRCIKVAGRGCNVLLANEEIDAMPIIAVGSKPMPHAHYGMSLADTIEELQRLKTALWRQTMDNLYLTNNPRMVVDDERINIEDLLNGRIGGIVRGDPTAFAAIGLPFAAAENIPIIQYIDGVREQRSGVSSTSQGLDPTALKDQSIYGMSTLMTAAQQKIRMIARVIGETGYKPLFRRIYELVCKHERREKLFYYNGRFVKFSPSAWRNNRDVMITVGLGNGLADERVKAMSTVIALQEKVVAAQGTTVGSQAVLVDVNNVYNALADMAEAAGVRNPAQYFKDPKEVKPTLDAEADQPPPPNPMVELQQQEFRLRETEKLADLEQKAKEHEDNLTFKYANLAVDAEQKNKQLVASILEKARGAVNG